MMVRQRLNAARGRAWSLGMVSALTVVLGCWGLLNRSGQAVAASDFVTGPPTDPAIYGRTLGEWSAAWWNWALQFPLETSPLFADGDVDCGMEQSGKVWFLAGSSSGEPSVRNCAIPEGKALFFPILNVVFWGPEDVPECAGCAIDSDPGACPPECEQALRELAFAVGDSAEDMTCTIDGEPCVFSHLVVRMQSPGFELEIPEGSLLNQFGVEAGVRPVAVSDGTWVMLPPLSPGEHDIHFTGYLAAFGFPLDVTYNITIEGDG